ncbi:hypothetical protein [Rhizobium terrae]|uniref:hypothetical protein n=1 Tax=Rhizobium terrae TaxID=2171756 RepID=UPI000E3C116D|nr:hypothetical protein [Rhizobium terrae]
MRYKFEWRGRKVEPTRKARWKPCTRRHDRPPQEIFRKVASGISSNFTFKKHKLKQWKEYYCEKFYQAYLEACEEVEKKAKELKTGEKDGGETPGGGPDMNREGTPALPSPVSGSVASSPPVADDKGDDASDLSSSQRNGDLAEEGRRDALPKTREPVEARGPISPPPLRKRLPGGLTGPHDNIEFLRGEGERSGLAGSSAGTGRPVKRRRRF